jgi:hypothetical protein
MAPSHLGSPRSGARWMGPRRSAVATVYGDSNLITTLDRHLLELNLGECEEVCLEQSAVRAGSDFFRAQSHRYAIGRAVAESVRG